MTLLLTECSKSGVVMAADSAISMKRGPQIAADGQINWTKVLEVPEIHAAVGYWGDIGRIHRGRFDEWLKGKIERTEYSDLPTLASALANTLNSACHDKPLPDNQCVGLHVAGFHAWEDAARRPFFLHVHNGHGHIEVEAHAVDGVVTKIKPVFVPAPRQLFKAYQEFPNVKETLEQNIDTLERGYVTRNGDLYYYTVMWEAFEKTFAHLNLIEGFKIPRNNTLGARRGLLIAALETTIRLYKCSNKSRIVGGPVVAVAIKQDGYMR
jgi:hypothetical protein